MSFLLYLQGAQNCHMEALSIEKLDGARTFVVLHCGQACYFKSNFNLSRGLSRDMVIEKVIGSLFWFVLLRRGGINFFFDYLSIGYG